MLRLVVFSVVAVAMAQAQTDKEKTNTRLFGGGVPGAVGGFPGGGGGFPGAGGGFPGAGGGFPGVGGGFPGAGGGFPGAGGGFPGAGGGFPGAGGGFPGGFKCNYCRTPVGYVCCKPGFCPPVRDVCPGVRNRPPICRQDTDCVGSDKCCFDRCLNDTVCKPIVSGSQG
ncbi:glycine-rich cell wall structural protein-like [Penaeus japonicus]|uniref:glycine-rich cell wall structural protein-like n=1 Tax=Penaeus japonicus TaxID=27405 RepID=UPI001C70CC99|nr:glycine-rich cell wall structural protein-like [Penaeus japonicus]